jgi:hypothetical protein
MKSFVLCTMIFFSFAVSAAPRASQSYLGVEGLDFIAPSVPDKTDVTNKQVGMIVYDVSTGQFFGVNQVGNWDPLTAPVASSRSEIVVDSGNGHGSTNTKVRRFSNIRRETGTDMRKFLIAFT